MQSLLWNETLQSCIWNVLLEKMIKVDDCTKLTENQTQNKQTWTVFGQDFTKERIIFNNLLLLQDLSPVSAGLENRVQPQDASSQ